MESGLSVLLLCAAKFEHASGPETVFVFLLYFLLLTLCPLKRNAIFYNTLCWLNLHNVIDFYQIFNLKKHFDCFLLDFGD